MIKTRANTSAHSQVLVLGVGNILMRDEGVGVRVVQRLEELYEIPPQVEVLDGGTSGVELLPYIEGKGALFIIDAMQKGDMAPGEVVVLDLSSHIHVYRNRISPHQLGISEVLALATLQEKIPPVVKLIGIRPSRVDTGLELSPEVEEAVDRAILLLKKELEGMGLGLAEKRG